MTDNINRLWDAAKSEDAAPLLAQLVEAGETLPGVEDVPEATTGVFQPQASS